MISNLNKKLSIYSGIFMKKQILLTLLMLSGLISIQHILGVEIYGNPYLNDKEDYEILKQAVFEKMGEEFAREFNDKHPMPSKESIEELALCFDHNPSFWFLSNPPQTTAQIGGKDINLRGTIADIIYDFLYE